MKIEKNRKKNILETYIMNKLSYHMDNKLSYHMKININVILIKIEILI
jgi:hypothetical protein